MQALGPLDAMLPASGTPAKPRFRGSSHQAACFTALGAGGLLVALAPTQAASLAAAVYACALVLLFGVSALYHRIDWAPGPRAWMRRADHATIFAFIASAYTPVCLLALPPGPGGQLLAWAWAGAALGILKSLLWPGSPRVVTVIPYLALGMLSLSQWGALSQSLSPLNVELLLLGGALYALGALAYAVKWPNPFPASFGYHEVFHAFTIVAGLAHFVVVADVVLHAHP